MKGYSRTNIKLSMTEPMYYINEKKRTVTCKLNGFLDGPVEGNCWLTMGDINFPHKQYETTTTAYCHENDRFDIERGKRIALSKAENELYNQAALEVSSVMDKIDFLREACKDFFNKALKCQAHNIDYIDSLSMPAHPKYEDGELPEKRGLIVEHIKA